MRPRSPLRTQLVVAALALAGALFLSSSAGATRAGVVLKAFSPASLAAALDKAKPGDSIALADGTYPKLSVWGRRYTGWVTISGTRNARIGGIVFGNSTNIVLRGVTITPTDGTAAVVGINKNSNAITLDRLLVDGRSESLGARINTDRSSSNVTIENSEITNCGRGSRCVGPGAEVLTVLGNKFHDCFDCDFIRGGGTNVTIRGNTFDRAVRGTCQGGAEHCPHNDHIQIMGGGPWSIVANRFGDRSGGAASIFVSTGLHNTENEIHDVLIASNLFKGTNTGAYGVEIAAGDPDSAPERVKVTNNTILSGSLAAVRLGPGWDVIARIDQPLVTDNILRVAGQVQCGRARHIANLVESGSTCKDNALGSAKLDNAGAPTGQSTLVINKADPKYQYPTDYYAFPRGMTPDRGAIEYRA
jgi:hypothetical protein